MYKKIIIKTFDSIFSNFDSLALKLLIPTLIISVLDYYLTSLIIDINVKELINIEYLSSNIIVLSIFFLLIMTNISIAVTTHRVSILGIDSVPKFGSFIFGLREFKLLFFTFVYGFIVVVPTALTLLIPVVGMFLAPIIGILLASRFALIFPSVACDEKFGFYDAWKATKKHNLLVILMVVLFPIIFSIIVGFIYSLAIEFLIELISSELRVLYSLLNIFITVFCIATLSSVYDYIRLKPLNEDISENNTAREIVIIPKKDSFQVLIHDEHPTSFETLKEELNTQYKKLGFTDLAYSRSKSWLLKKPFDEEPYISLRYDGDEYKIYIYKSEEPKLKLLKRSRVKKTI